ncbi:hypothetical protein NEOLEDRAFT_1129098 [Neolentinus lepideus HHB14362 ss-1]|uniref:Uncharacterized protein n=1 Tax=Neolentinus lepideus HHB14362 ss-1 TaxID=1314782 RepID=A0A165UXE4_9AGAM|nr:hypothetical protein NEOLEDRAFT_1129098 [Neolentinus lepideus HHB14362 ss-1]
MHINFPRELARLLTGTLWVSYTCVRSMMPSPSSPDISVDPARPRTDVALSGILEGCRQAKSNIWNAQIMHLPADD